MKQQALSDITFEWASSYSMPSNAPIYMGLRYQSMLAAYDGGQVRLLVCSRGGYTAWLPMLVKEIGNGVCEAYSAYGYGGFFGDLKLSIIDIHRLKDYLARARIIAIFLRHSPFLFNQSMLPEGLITLNRHTYVADLSASGSFDDFLTLISQKLRWSVNYALRAGLNVTFYPLSNCGKERIHSFYSQYAMLMTEKKVSDYHQFSESFFQDHALYIGADCEFAEITTMDGQFMGGAFFLLDNSGMAHYHLSALSRNAMKLQGMELLMLSALYRFGARGYSKLHLGGGHALDESDGLSRFKAKFASQRLNFYCSMLICDEVSYSHERSRLPLSHSAFFLISDARGKPRVPEATCLGS